MSPFLGIAPLGLSQSCGMLGAEEQTPLEPSRARGWPGNLHVFVWSGLRWAYHGLGLVATALGDAWQVGLGQRTQG